MLVRRPDGMRFDPPDNPLSPPSGPDVIGYLQTQIMVLEDAILDRDRALAEIKASRAWKLAEKSSATVQRFAPLARGVARP